MKKNYLKKKSLLLLSSSKILYSYQKHFPRMKCSIVIDIVSLSKKVPTIMPGFDYVHGLQGFTPRTYEETIETFEKGAMMCYKKLVCQICRTHLFGFLNQMIYEKIIREICEKIKFL